ncbi:MAG: hypothetical protein PHQ04_06230 [Opitutaceae bacterium]|nr:hypothetical protein [Opitutaceae bacterium]
MIRALKNLLNRIPIRLWVRSDRRLKTSYARRAQFVSFLEDSGFRRHNPDRYERSLRLRRLLRLAFFWLSAFGTAWVVIESARALAMY